MNPATHCFREESPTPGCTACGQSADVHTGCDCEDERPLPDSIADIADEHGVTEAQLRQALREAHPDASAAEVILRAREVPVPDDDEPVDHSDCDHPPSDRDDLNYEGDPTRNGAFG